MSSGIFMVDLVRNVTQKVITSFSQVQFCIIFQHQPTNILNLHTEVKDKSIVLIQII